MDNCRWDALLRRSRHCCKNDEAYCWYGITIRSNTTAGPYCQPIRSPKRPCNRIRDSVRFLVLSYRCIPNRHHRYRTLRSPVQRVCPLSCSRSSPAAMLPSTITNIRTLVVREKAMSRMCNSQRNCTHTVEHQTRLHTTNPKPPFR